MLYKKQMVFRILILALLLPLSANAQNRTGGRINDPGRINPFQQLQQQFANAAATVSGLLVMEGAVDMDAYIVGPGDQFSLSLGGSSPLQLIAPVSAEGQLQLFDVGSIPAAGKTLREVVDLATETLSVQYANIAVNVSLQLPRRFYVHLAGAVPEPGRYLMLPLARLDDAVQQAFAPQATARPDPTAGGEVRIVGSAASEIPATQAGYNPSLRNIKIMHSDGSSSNFDLFRYYIEGNLAHNPYLKDGDVISLATYDERNAILVTGGVASPGKIEYRAGDTVLDIINFVTNESDLVSLDRVRLTRRNKGVVEPPVDLNLQDLLNGTLTPPTLMPGDHINVQIPEVAEAAIYGFVNYPGTFPIENAKTTLRELVTLAGGLKPEASLRAAYLERRQSQARKPGSETSDLDFFERTYFRKSLAQNSISINIESALQPDAEDVILYSGDVVVFPRDEQTIHVVGNVLKPGYIPFTPGKPASYYVQLAGGEGPLTTGSYVFEAGSGKVYTNTNHIVKPGDTVFINRQSIADTPELQALLLQNEVSARQTRIARTQTIITGITALVSVVNTFLLIRDRLNN